MGKTMKLQCDEGVATLQNIITSGWIGDLEQLLAEVLTGKQSVQRIRDILKTFLEVDLELELPGLNPAKQILDGYARTIHIINNNETFHSRPHHNQVHRETTR